MGSEPKKLHHAWNPATKKSKQGAFIGRLYVKDSLSLPKNDSQELCLHLT